MTQTKDAQDAQDTQDAEGTAPEARPAPTPDRGVEAADKAMDRGPAGGDDRDKAKTAGREGGTR